MGEKGRTSPREGAMREYLEISEVVRRGDRAALEAARRTVDAFPDGKDTYLGIRWMLHAIDSGALQSVAWMLDTGVALDFCDAEGYTPIHSCLEREGEGRYRVLRMLLEAGAEVNARGLNDWTPLHMAAAREDQRAIRMLLDAGADRSIRTRIDHLATPEEEARLLGKHAAADFLRDQD